jgi:hypothetical protein
LGEFSIDLVFVGGTDEDLEIWKLIGSNKSINPINFPTFQKSRENSNKTCHQEN